MGLSLQWYLASHESDSHCWFSCHYFSTLIGKLLFCSLWFYAKMGSWSLLYLLAGDVSKFGAGLFLLVQVLILLDFTHSWNDAWVEKDEQKWWVVVLIYVISTVTGLIWVVTVWIYNSGISLCLLYQLGATLQRLRSQAFCSFGSTPLAMTVVLMSSSLSWPWFLHLHLQWLHYTQR